MLQTQLNKSNENEPAQNCAGQSMIEELRQLHTLIQRDLEEERRLHAESIRILERALNIYEKKLDLDSLLLRHPTDYRDIAEYNEKSAAEPIDDTNNNNNL